MRNILVIGSGLTGAVLAYRHRQAGDSVTVLEKREHVGGNVYTQDVNGITIHMYGAHIFHTDSEQVWDFVNRFVSFNGYRHQVKSRYKGDLYSLPINMNTFREFFGITDRTDVKREHLDHVYSTLFAGYSAKQWGKPMEEIDPEVFRRLPVRYTFDNDYFSDRYQGIPEHGYTPLILCLLHGCVIATGVTVTQDFDFSPYDRIYNTGPIDEFFCHELGALEYRSLEFRTETYRNNAFQEYAVVNEACFEVPYTRTIEHKRFNDKGQSGTVITREYPRKHNGRNEPFYTVNTPENNALHEKYKLIAAQRYPNMVFCGRLGSYRYYDMDDAILEALNMEI